MKTELCYLNYRKFGRVSTVLSMIVEGIRIFFRIRNGGH